MKKFTSQEIKEFVSKPLFYEEVILNKDHSWPKISIVTPSYNQGKFLERIGNKLKEDWVSLYVNNTYLFDCKCDWEILL